MTWSSWSAATAACWALRVPWRGRLRFGGRRGIGHRSLIGEIGLWVGAGCQGLTLFKTRQAMLDKLFRRQPRPSEV